MDQINFKPINAPEGFSGQKEAEMQAPGKTCSALGNLPITQFTLPQYESGAEKLKEEKKTALKTLKAEFRPKAEPLFSVLFDELIKHCKMDPQFDSSVNQSHKSFVRYIKYVSEKVMEMGKPTDEQKLQARTNRIPICIPVSSEQMMQWAKKYYGLNDKAEVEKELVANAKRKDDAEKAQKKVAGIKEKNVAVQNPKAAPPPKAKPKEPEKKQMSFFDMFGGE